MLSPEQLWKEMCRLNNEMTALLTMASRHYKTANTAEDEVVKITDAWAYQCPHCSAHIGIPVIDVVCKECKNTLTANTEPEDEPMIAIWDVIHCWKCGEANKMKYVNKNQIALHKIEEYAGKHELSMVQVAVLASVQVWLQSEDK